MIPGKKEHEFVDPPMEDEGSFVDVLDNTTKSMVEYLSNIYQRRSSYLISPIIPIVGVFIFITAIWVCTQIMSSVTDVTQQLILVNITVTCLLGFLLMLYRVDMSFVCAIIGIPIIYITKQLYLLWVKHGSRKE
jgi:uncharacterized membrane protein